MTVNFLSGGRLSAISHVRKVGSFVFSLNKRRKGNQPEDPRLPADTGQGHLPRVEASVPLWSSAPAQLGLETASLRTLVLVREQDILGSECLWVLGLFSQEFDLRVKGKFHSLAV